MIYFRLALVLITFLAIPARAEDRWYIAQIDGKKAGYARESETRENNTITSTSEMTFSLARMGQSVTMKLSTRFVETEAGDAVSMTSTQNLGAHTVTEEYAFIRGIASYEIMRTSTIGDHRAEARLPWPEGDWKTPAAASRHIEERLAAGDKTITYSTLDPTIGTTPVTLTHTIRGNADIEAMGKTVPAIRWDVENSAMPGIISTDFVNASGRSLRTEINLGGMKLILLAAERELALSPFDAPELMAQTLVTPKLTAPIRDPRHSTRAEYILTRKDGAPLALIESAAAQSCVIGPAGALHITVDLARHQPAADAPPAASKPTTMLDARDERIRTLVTEALNNLEANATPAHKAEALRRHVHSYIQNATLGVGFATASEVARTRRGDCSEYAVLLAAALRAADIPSRAVSGVVFIHNYEGHTDVFGYHMWTQALLHEGAVPRWIDLDATMQGDAPFDAAHIALATSFMDEGDMINSMAGLVTLLGQLEIEIKHIE